MAAYITYFTYGLDVNGELRNSTTFTVAMRRCLLRSTPRASVTAHERRARRRWIVDDRTT